MRFWISPSTRIQSPWCWDGLIGMTKAYTSRYQQFYSKQNWDGSMSLHFHWLFSGEISNYRIRICIYLFALSTIEKDNLIISLINNLIVFCEHNLIVIGGQNNRQNQIPWLLIYYVCRLNPNQAIPYSDNQNIFGGNMLLCPRCKELITQNGFTFLKQNISKATLIFWNTSVLWTGL